MANRPSLRQTSTDSAPGATRGRTGHRTSGQRHQGGAAPESQGEEAEGGGARAAGQEPLEEPGAREAETLSAAGAQGAAAGRRRQETGPHPKRSSGTQAEDRPQLSISRLVSEGTWGSVLT